MKDENVPTEIIGVVADHKHLGLDVDVEPVSYWPHPELVYSRMRLGSEWRWGRNPLIFEIGREWRNRQSAIGNRQ